MSCLHPHLSARYSYRKGCRCGRCSEALRLESAGRQHCLCVVCGKDSRIKPGQPELCSRCRQLTEIRAPEPDERTRAWAARVWNAWTPKQQAEVAGALESLIASLRGEGDGRPARGRYVAPGAEKSASESSADVLLTGPKRSIAERLEEKAGTSFKPWRAGKKYLNRPERKRAA